jgi:hypothetical protein
MKTQIYFYLTMVMALLSMTVSSQNLPRFAVISDTHFENNRGEGAVVKVPKALKNLTSKTPLIDADFVVGDLTNDGTEDQYNQFISCFNNTENVPSSVGKYYLMGNHDNFTGASAPSTFSNKTGQAIHQYVVIKDYPFITISQMASGTSGAGTNDYNAAACSFLTEKLALARQTYPGKPIFVFVHVPPRNTCYGSGDNEGWGMNVLVPILNNYPEVIVFSGHSHFPLGDPRSIHQDKFTAINDGSTTYSEVEPNVVMDGIHPQNFEKVTEGVIVNVLENGDVEMERWDTYRNEEILPRWTIKAPHNGTQFSYKNRTGIPSPSFPDGEKPKVAYIDGILSCTVTFPQAIDNEAVFSYLIQVLDGDNVIASQSKFSQFYLNSDAPEPFSVFVSNLPSNKTLVARVKAFDSYKNESTWINSEPFATGIKKSIPVAELNPTLYYSFEDPNNYAVPAIGTSNLLFYDKDGSNKTLGIPGNPPTGQIEGPYSGKKAVTIPKNKHIKVLNTIGTSDEGAKLNTYSLLFDIKFRTANQWYVLFQTNPENTDDGEIFIKNSSVSGTIGLASTGYSAEVLVPNQWYRVVVTMKWAGSNAEYRIYLDGTSVVSYNGVTAKDGRFSIDNAFCIFTDEDGEENDIDCAGFAFWGNTALSQEEVALLGFASVSPGAGINPINISAKETHFYPNPVSDIIHFDETNGLVSIYDLLGREVLSTSFQTGKANISSLKEGTYVIRIWTDGKVYSSKLIKQ